jgi:hypothetical protein
VTETLLEEQIASPGLPAWDIARYHANVWIPTFESWLQAGAWEACGEEDVSIPDESPVFLGSTLVCGATRRRSWRCGSARTGAG